MIIHNCIQVLHTSELSLKNDVKLLQSKVASLAYANKVEEQTIH